MIYLNYNPVFKRLLDILLSLTSLLFFWPLFIIIAILIRIDSKGPIIFRQKRYGQDKNHFYILKFRTMCMETPSDMPTHKLDNPDACITRVGKILRKTSLDELPQLLNILKGEMSIIGPRPVVLCEHDVIRERDKYGANDIKPGITGWAQINGRDELSAYEKAKFDGEYTSQVSFYNDFKIFLKTIFYVIKREGVREGSQDITSPQPNMQLIVNKPLNKKKSINNTPIQTMEKQASVR
ncbi:sugar transferase [Alkalicella caledoniensis]|uniref:Sugar transferase n=1 Tax=Alkalicella caledoniensis TaxID=2731377 RepID=A0A7G9W410_ALKCA|nr:sugar transferase [Alkalicella caledoniensis]QNO13422.1 sugar transferase [Alkalicella caledoniensis]